MKTLVVRKKDTGYLCFEIPIPDGQKIEDNKTFQNIKDDERYFFYLKEAQK